MFHDTFFFLLFFWWRSALWVHDDVSGGSPRQSERHAFGGDAVAKAAGETKAECSQAVTQPSCSASAGRDSQDPALSSNHEGRGQAPVVQEAPSLSPTASQATTTASELASLVRARNERWAELRAAGRRAWEEVKQHTQAACDAVVSGANAEVLAAFAREKKIETELKAVAACSAQLQMQMSAWTTLFGKLNTELKEMGDVSNWVRSIEEDLAETVHVLEELSEQK
ncbi:GCN5-like protein [Trypanosoma rangeli]|uniref:Biogenesis of lysosome-related organelles complex 1 subunit 1 n=1 Tax=Trypanosoma rangeli TaxID=5698 RepID=A0A422P256_TRYRA|nr:GCN5-like protein [Trypanosoma rangeli]RNF11754.1 GCN5-like protein [Trypanosoma rangeli]|eukprot:RNF11754.1 GCN5-like protein [Trypanosoma rangeli]